MLLKYEAIIGYNGDDWPIGTMFLQKSETCGRTVESRLQIKTQPLQAHRPGVSNSFQYKGHFRQI